MLLAIQKMKKLITGENCSTDTGARHRINRLAPINRAMSTGYAFKQSFPYRFLTESKVFRLI